MTASQPRPHRLARLRSRAWLAVWLLVAALLAAQALGLVHRVVHGGKAPAGVAQLAHVHVAAHATHAIDVGDAPTLAHLFAGHADDAGCRLYDGLAHAGLVLHPLLLLPQALAPPPQAPALTSCSARFIAAFHARGPPAQD